ncbi:hypothetical protein [Bacillus wiedmannii]|uniref:hypothetical protein n=1 Tax=Bacillus wiedmannii TaxID=1890302 RepID=UPI003D303B5E
MQHKTSSIDKDLSLKDFLKEIGWDKRKFHYHREFIQDRYNLNLELFKKGSNNTEKHSDEDHYSFKKEWNELAIMLYKLYDKSPFKAKGKNIEKLDLETLLQFQNDSINLIHGLEKEYVSELLGHPAFHSAIVEINALDDVIKKYDLLMQGIESVSIETRAMFWIYLSESLNEMLIKLQQIDLYGKNRTKNEMAGFESFTFSDYKHKSLDFLIASYLNKLLQKENFIERNQFKNDVQEANKILDRHISQKEKEWIDSKWFDEIDSQIQKQLALLQIQQAIQEQLSKLKPTSQYLNELLTHYPNLHEHLDLSPDDLQILINNIDYLEKQNENDIYTEKFKPLFSKLLGSVMEKE